MTENPDRFGLGVMQEFGRDALDPGYAEAARRREHGHTRPRSRSATVAWVLVAMLLAGGVVGSAIRWNQLAAPSANRAQQGLMQDIIAARSRAQDLDATAADLDDQVRAEQQRLGAGGPLATVQQLEQVGTGTAVTGPGLHIVIDTGNSDNAILDRDVQLLVNGLWSAGAEAIAIGGVRLRTTSAIRQAGGAILVDNKPTFWPLSIDAIGDPAKVHVAFSRTTGFARFTAFEANYGMQFDVTEATQLDLPAAPPPNLRYADTGAAAAPSTRNTR